MLQCNNPLKLFSGILTGGLTAVIYTDTLCTFLMVTGSLTVMGLGNLFCLWLKKAKKTIFTVIKDWKFWH